jgi:hypothetical protein
MSSRNSEQAGDPDTEKLTPKVMPCEQFWYVSEVEVEEVGAIWGSLTNSIRVGSELGELAPQFDSRA